MNFSTHRENAPFLNILKDALTEHIDCSGLKFRGEQDHAGVMTHCLQVRHREEALELGESFLRILHTTKSMSDSSHAARTPTQSERAPSALIWIPDIADLSDSQRCSLQLRQVRPVRNTERCRGIKLTAQTRLPKSKEHL